MHKALRDIIAAIEGECAKFGAKVGEVIRSGGGHLKVALLFNGQQRHLFCASTPGDHRNEKNTLKQARMLIRQMAE